jgi:periplasmic protein TonB
MPRDLFIDTVTHKYAPKRSKWTIAGSILAHTALLAGVLVVPILSALDDYIVYANKLTFTLPPAAMPAMPAPPPKVATPVPMVNPNAAPPAPPEHAVTNEVPPATSFGPPPPPGMIFGAGPPGIPGVSAGDRSSVIDTFRKPEPKKPEPVRIGGDIKAPARTYYVAPVYPTVALTVKEEGTVTLEAMIDEAGNVKDLKVIGSRPLLDKAAMEAVSRWRYTPTRLNGVAVPIILTVRVTFALR